MNIIKTNIPGVLFIEPRVFKDYRGYYRQFFIPRGFAHGFAVLSETAVFQYKCDEFYHPEADGGINIKDESLGIDWRIPMEKAILSEKDLKHACLKDAVLDFDINDKLYK